MGDLLTSTRLTTSRRCPRQYYYRYELGLSRIRTSDPLRLGAAFHRGLELRNKGTDTREAVEGAIAGYVNIPDWAEPYEWQVECETVCLLLAGYSWRYGNDDVKVIASEQTFEMPLLNPETKRYSRTFRLAGKIDGIAELPDGRIVVLEDKTAGEDISPDSNYWLRLRCDLQLSQYVLGARWLGYDVSTVLYDVTRKPTIAPLRATPPEKRKYTKAGVLYAKQREQDEAPADFGDRLLEDMGKRPDFYFQRREAPRLEDELADFQLELWQQAKQLIEARRYGRWYRNVGRFTCDYCEFVDLCLQGVKVEVDTPPSGFEFLSNVHPELGEENDISTDKADSERTASTTV